MPSMPELLILLAIIVLLFGAKKIPDLAKGVGKGIKTFKKEMKDDEEANEIKKADAHSEQVEEKMAAELKPETKETKETKEA